MFDEDFSSICGEFADLDGDGRVDMEEYLNEEDDYNRIMGNENEDEDYSFDDEDEDEYEYEGEDFESDDETDNSETEHPITFAADYNNDNKNRNHQTFNIGSIEERYYDRYKKEYRISDAVYENFPLVSDNFKKREVIDDLYNVIYKVYFSDKNTGLQMLIWIANNFRKAIRKGDFCTNFVITEMIGRDNNTEEDVILKYIYEHPNFEKIVLGEQFVSSKSGIYWYDDKYVCYLCKRNDIERIISSYQILCSNPNIDTKEYPKEQLLNDIVFHLQISGVRYVDKQLYDFFKAEIESVGKPIKVNYLMENLNFEEYGRPLFSKTENGKMKCIYFEDDEDEDENENEEEITDSTDTEENLEEEHEVPLWLKQRISDLEEKSEEANKRIVLLEQLLGISDRCDSIEKRVPKKPSTTPEDENEFFEHSLNVMGVQYADEYAVKNVSVGDTVMFLPEPENEYDKNAILVLDIRGYKLGYIPRWANKQLLKNIESTGAYGIVSRVGQDQKYIEIDVWIKAAE